MTSISIKEIDKRLDNCFKTLNLNGMNESFQSNETEFSNKDFKQSLLSILELEVEYKSGKKVERLLKASRLPLIKNIETFDLTRLPLKLRRKTDVLIDGAFIDRCENVLAFGKPGSGKTHLLCAIAQEQIHKGRSVYYASCNLLVQELLMAKRQFELPKALKKLSKYELLILDDIGYVQQNREEIEVLFTLLAERYERGSVMITSNLPFSKWEQIFKDPMTTAAAIDRLVHHCVILDLNLPSYRTLKAKEKLAHI